MTSNLFQIVTGRLIVPAIDMTLVTSTVDMFASTYGITRCNLLNVSTSMDISNSVMTGAELNNLYSNLAVIAGKTLTVTGSFGVGDGTEDQAIATAKGWTVVS